MWCQRSHAKIASKRALKGCIETEGGKKKGRVISLFSVSNSPPLPLDSFSFLYIFFFFFFFVRLVGVCVVRHIHFQSLLLFSEMT